MPKFLLVNEDGDVDSDHATLEEALKAGNELAEGDEGVFEAGKVELYKLVGTFTPEPRKVTYETAD